MFLLAAFKPQNKFWKYLVGSLIIIAASTLGQLPFGVAIAIKALTSGKGMPQDEAAMFRLLDLNLGFFLIMLSFVVALLAIILVVKNIHRQKLEEIITSRPKVDWKRVFFAFTVWGLFSVVSTLYVYYTSPENYVLQFNLTKFLILCLIAIPLIPVQTSVEELVFRGYLMQGFGLLAKNKWFPLVLTSVIFGSMHLMNPEVKEMGYFIVIYYIATGFLLGIMTLMDDGMELSLGFHAANNLTAALLVTADWTALQTPSVFKDISIPSVGFDVLLPVVIVYPILLFIFAKKYKWFGWKEKLTGTIVPPNEEKNIDLIGYE